MSKIYSTVVTNDSGSTGLLKFSDGEDFVLGKEGTNPEQLMGGAWSTCLNTVLKMILKAKGEEGTKSKVEVLVDLVKEADEYHFEMIATISVEGYTLEETEEIAELAHSKCPVSKLIAKSETIKVKAALY